MSEIIELVGLSLERHWYIYQNLRSSISDIKIVDSLPEQQLATKKQMSAASGDVLELGAVFSSQLTCNKRLSKAATNKNIKKT